jgi:hypothetical protein
MRRLLLVALTALALCASGSPALAVNTYPPVMICDPNTGVCGGVTTLGSSGPAATIACDQSVTVSAAAANTQLVAASTGKVIYVCAYAISVAGTTTPTGNLESGTGTVCATGPTVQTLSYPAGTFTIGNGLGSLNRTAASGALCLYVAGTGPVVSVTVTYAQF